MAEANPMPLTGLRVVEIATLLAAPMAGMLLGDYGAEVIKVEMPGQGDGMRRWGYEKDGVPLMWKMLARNKKLVTLDLHKARGKELFLALIAKADVLIESFRPGTMDRWGLTADVLRKVRPDLIVLRVSGFGQTGPKSGQAGFGTLAEAMAGFAYINGWPDKPPALPPFGLADAVAGLAGAFGILAAINHRRNTGQGQDVDIALYEPILTVLGSLLIDYDQLGIIQERSGNRTPFAAPRNAYATADGKWFVLSASSQSTAQRLFEAMDQPKLISDDRFSDNRRRVENIDELDRLISAWAGTLDLPAVLNILEKAGVPAGAINSAGNVIEDPHVIERGSVICVEDEQLGRVRVQAPIPRMTATPGQVQFLGGTLGQHNSLVYRGLLGLSEADLAELIRERVI
jgi:crotonobetainyl-CoA:carnitine CoA-transferase CaiB-like acyl-CoA transferase